MPLVLESQAVVECQVWRWELNFSRRSNSSLYCWTIPWVCWKAILENLTEEKKPFTPQTEWHLPEWSRYKVGQGECCSLPACLHPCWWVLLLCGWLCCFYPPPPLIPQESCRFSIPDGTTEKSRTCRLHSYWILSLCHVLWVTLGLQCAVWKLILEIPFKHIYLFHWFCSSGEPRLRHLILFFLEERNKEI